MKLLYIQPFIASYRGPVIASLAKNFKLAIAANANINAGAGFKMADIEGIPLYHAPCIDMLGGRLIYQRGVLAAICKEAPDIVFIPANPRNLSYWICLFVARLIGVRVISHGQGLYRKPTPSVASKLMYGMMALFSYKYVAYNNYAAGTMPKWPMVQKRVAYIDNTVTLNTEAEILTLKTGSELGVLFVGRLREQCGIEDLIVAMLDLRQKVPNAELHIIGAGSEYELVREYSSRYDWIFAYGPIFDDNKIAEISQKCRFGCYPGAAGLSVVHMFGMGLPPIISDDISRHMGPEPAYVINGVNGLTFDSKIDPPKALAAVLRQAFLLSSPSVQYMSRSAKERYVQLNSLSFGDQLHSLLVKR